MQGYKNIITWAVKIALGLCSFALIYWRLHNDLNAEKTAFLASTFTSAKAWMLLLACLLMVPFNWGIESYKWRFITTPVEALSLKRAMASVYAGVCAGNLAPGRATEFLAKIFFFQPANRPSVTLLHFVNGMFQLSVTLLLGLIAVLFRFRSMGMQALVFWTILSFCLILLITFSIVILNFKKVQSWLLSRFKDRGFAVSHSYDLGKRTIVTLAGWSLLRYAVFSSQLLLIICLFYHGPVTGDLMAGIAIYFLLTTALPMISIIEPAIRAAIALAVFSGLSMPEVSVVIVAVLLWIVNIVIPSIIGYLVILRHNFTLKNLKG